MSRPWRRPSLVLFVLWLLAGARAHPQDVPLEYQVKAVYLFNFVKAVEWPAEPEPGPITICVAGANPFGEALTEAVKGELVNGRPLEARTIPKPDSGCQVVFVPAGITAAPYLDAALDMPTLTVGEAEDFLDSGGIIRFVEEAGRVRFQIDPAAARRAELRISSHLLNLSRGRARG